MLYERLEELIGNTPLLHAVRTETGYGLCAHLYAKLESFNPAGSAKDRPAREMLDDAERRGLLQPGGTVIEPTSGNTGIGLCALCAARGYRAVIVMPDTMSEERRTLMRAYGADVVLTPGAGGMAAAIAKAEELKQTLPGAIVAGQFTNPANTLAHYRTTGPEICRDLNGKVDVFVAGVGTGGTLTGTARFLRERCPGCHVVAVEPASSPYLSEKRAGPHAIQGIGAGFVPDILDTSLMDEIIPVKDEDAFAAARAFGRTEGVLCGISSGAALCAAVEVAKRDVYRDKNVVVLLPDGGDHYLSTSLYADKKD